MKSLQRQMRALRQQFTEEQFKSINNDLADIFADELRKAIDKEIIDTVFTKADDNLLAMVIPEQAKEALTGDMQKLMKRCFHAPPVNEPDSNAIAIGDHILHEVREGVISPRQIVMRLIDKTSDQQAQVVARSFAYAMSEVCPIKVSFKKPISEHAVKTFMESYGVPGVIGLYWTQKDHSSHVYFSDAAAATLGSGYFSAL